MGATRAITDIPVIAVVCGKGGVGKTSVAVALARRLVAAGRKVGLVDADLHGPDVPRMLGLRRDVPAKSLTIANWVGGRNSGIEAMEVDGLKVASVGFLLAGQQGFAVDASIGDMMLGRLIRDTRWGDVDTLVVDLPPGTGDVQQALLALAGPVAAVLVVTPAEVAHLDTNRALTILKDARVTIIGGVENMVYLECGGCGEATALHDPAPEERTIWARNVPKLASLPYRVGGAIGDADIAPVVSSVTGYLGRAL
ncbi:P-loop NTPase [Actinoalloteichus sp. GBA129-24]|uniref:P-loop NTPase n=1 Tax=Actinoalloteichus sp. GBA129-24 TaxID=1612551 RepID=UPI000950A45A|nr:P-loop NTPase [Actinoalloteichus sp. GBA129-24]APU21631.1 Anion-transporting ATPase/ParA/MinD ATPase like [Actinoalloteichus sp. GBA129-24]